MSRKPRYWSLKETDKIKTGDKAVASIEPFETPVGEKFIGRILSPLAEPLDGLGPIEFEKKNPIFPESPPILVRQPLKKPWKPVLRFLMP